MSSDIVAASLWVLIVAVGMSALVGRRTGGHFQRNQLVPDVNNKTVALLHECIQQRMLLYEKNKTTVKTEQNKLCYSVFF